MGYFLKFKVIKTIKKSLEKSVDKYLTFCNMTPTNVSNNIGTKKSTIYRGLLCVIETFLKTPPTPKKLIREIFY